MTEMERAVRFSKPFLGILGHDLRDTVESTERDGTRLFVTLPRRPPPHDARLLGAARGPTS